MNPEGLDHEPLFLALAWFNGMTATLMVGRLSRWFVAHRETPPPGAVVPVDHEFACHLVLLKECPPLGMVHPHDIH